jgi:hypothetical protein
LKLARCPHSLIASLATLPSMSLIPLTLSLPLSRPFGFAHLCRGFPARSIRSIDEAGARNGPISTRCCARERVKRPIFLAL